MLTILLLILNPINFINQSNQINRTSVPNDPNDLNHLNQINPSNPINPINPSNSIAWAEDSKKQPTAGPAQPVPAISKHPFRILPLDVSEDYVIGQGDVLEVFVWRNEELSRQVTVRPDGKISLPLVQDLQAEGLTALQLQDQITRKFKQYVQNPTVAVIVSQINSYKISVLGKVVQPGVYPITTRTTILEAISLAGGFTEWANQKKITVITTQGGQKKKLRVNYKKIISGKDPSQNITLTRGDTIIVPWRRVIQMANFKAQKANEILISNDKKVYNLEERTGQFGENVIDFVKTLPRNVINKELIGQIVRSGTSIGANYMEADGAESKKDFRHKIALCKKESKETKHWLRISARANPNKQDECKKLSNEAQELTLIFSSILLPRKNSDKSS